MPLTHSPTRFTGQNQSNSMEKNDEECQEVKKTRDNFNEINASSMLKLPPFWKENPNLWFSQIEIAFDIARISSDQTKFRYTIINLDQTVLPFISDIINNPPETEKYETLKNRIISSFDESNESKLRKLLRGNEILDEKPSNFLQRLRNLAGELCNENVLRTIFLEQLPDQVRGILAISEVKDLTKLATQADKIVEVLRPAISEIYKTLNPNKENTSNNSLQNEVSELRKMIETLSVKTDRNQYRGRYRSRSRSRSNFRRNRFRNRFRSRQEDSTLCYYHHRFGERSFKCQEPCSWTGKDKRNEQTHPEN